VRFSLSMCIGQGAMNPRPCRDEIVDRVFVWEDYPTIRRSHDDHHRNLAAIAGRDPARAERLMREHIFFAGQVLRRAAETTPDWWRGPP